jgi:hypothetical protein
LAWVNSDDVLLPGAIARVRHAFAADPNLGVVTGWGVYIDANSRVLYVRTPPAQTLFAARWGVTHIIQPACFFRRTLYEAAGGLNESLGAVLDTELWFRILKLSPRWGIVPAFQAAFRVHEAQKGQAWLDVYAREYVLLARMHPEFAGRNLVHPFGRTVYRMTELVKGRYARDFFLSMRHRGKHLAEFPEQPSPTEVR